MRARSRGSPRRSPVPRCVARSDAVGADRRARRESSPLGCDAVRAYAVRVRHAPLRIEQAAVCGITQTDVGLFPAARTRESREPPDSCG